MFCLGKTDTSEPSCCDRKTQLVAPDNPAAKPLMIGNKQLLDATQLVVWQHLCQRLDREHFHSKQDRDRVR